MAQKAEWTVMVFLNGDNNLESFGLIDFREMASVPDSTKVNIVVQFDRNGGYATTTPQWKGCHRFKIAKGMKPTPANALESLGDTNMGKGTTLRDFVNWAMEAYPAKKYMLDIWNHGQGWRFFETTVPAVAGLELNSFLEFRADKLECEASRLSRSPLLADGGIQAVQSIPLNRTVRGTVRSISSDDTSGDTLYNREIQDSLAGVALDIIGFDACLMSMVETAYAVRHIAKVMVGSEELEPGDGWNYSDWLGALVKHPEMDAADLGKALVNSFRKTYEGRDETVTLSALDLSRMRDVASRIDDFADALMGLDSTAFGGVKKARLECDEFAPGYGLHGIDLSRFATRVATHVAPMNGTVSALKADLSKSVIASHVGEDRKGNFGATGIAIYFPASRANFQADPDNVGYVKTNGHYPVEFVQKHRWADFLLNCYLPRT